MPTTIKLVRNYVITYWLWSWTWTSLKRCWSFWFKFPSPMPCAFLCTSMVLNLQCKSTPRGTWIVSKSTSCFNFHFLYFEFLCIHSLMLSSCFLVEVCFHLGLGVYMCLQEKSSSIVLTWFQYFFHMLRLKPRSWIPCFHHLGLGILLGIIVQLKLSLTTRP